MVPMETQLQSIFEEVVVSATVRKPEPWLREVQAAGLGQLLSRPYVDIGV